VVGFLDKEAVPFAGPRRLALVGIDRYGSGPVNRRRAKSPKNKNKGRTHAHHNNSSKTNDPAKPDEDPTHPPAEQQAGQRKTRQKPTAQGTPPQGVTFPFNAHDG
jgi:hypothetical protein